MLVETHIMDKISYYNKYKSSLKYHLLFDIILVTVLIFHLKVLFQLKEIYPFYVMSGLFCAFFLHLLVTLGYFFYALQEKRYVEAFFTFIHSLILVLLTYCLFMLMMLSLAAGTYSSGK